jgi:hypothetical protein
MSGLLGSIFSFGDDLKKRARGLLGDPLGYANATVGEFNDKAQSAARGLLAGKGGMESVDALGAGPHGLGGLLGGIKVFHGSPHVFDKADSSKIGTGEGAQAYGHGLYWAENPAVAQEYQRDLSTKVTANGQRLLDNNKRVGSTGNPEVDDYLIANNGDVEAALRQAILARRSLPLSNGNRAEYDPTIAALKSLRGNVDVRMDGNLYEANLRWPDAAREARDPLGPQHFLDWDKPLGQQPKNVQSVFGPVDPNGRINTGLAYQRWREAQGVDPVAAAGKLKELGIPGVSYMDAGSRAAGQGTRNYVTFDDALVELLSRNGQPLLGR